MDIFSKRGETRDEDKHAKAYLRQNWGTIEKLADQISGGGYSKNKARIPTLAQQPGKSGSGLIFVDQAAPAQGEAPAPYLRISLNGRVVLADLNSGQQLHFLGQLKRQNGVVRFQLATAENGFISALDPSVLTLIADMADHPLGGGYGEEDLARDLKTRLSLT